MVGASQWGVRVCIREEEGIEGERKKKGLFGKRERASVVTKKRKGRFFRRSSTLLQC